MIFDSYTSILASLFKAWQSGKRHVRASLVLVILLGIVAIMVALLSEAAVIDKKISEIIAGVFGVIAGLITFGVIAYQGLVEQQAREQRIETVEERLREHPEKPQLAWDLARTKLENYLDRNLSQVRSIYWLTLVVGRSRYAAEPKLHS